MYNNSNFKITMNRTQIETDILEIRRSLAIQTVRRVVGGKLYLNIMLPHQCGVNGYLYHQLNSLEAYLQQISVQENLRHHGFGRRLLLLFAAVSADLGASSFYADVMSRNLLKLEGNTFGEEALTFREIPKKYPNGKSAKIQAPLKQLIARFQPLRVFTDLTKFNFNNEERPLRYIQETTSLL